METQIYRFGEIDGTINITVFLFKGGKVVDAKCYHIGGGWHDDTLEEATYASDELEARSWLELDRMHGNKIK